MLSTEHLSDIIQAVKSQRMGCMQSRKQDRYLCTKMAAFNVCTRASAQNAIVFGKKLCTVQVRSPLELHWHSPSVTFWAAGANRPSSSVADIASVWHPVHATWPKNIVTSTKTSECTLCDYMNEYIKNTRYT